MGDKSIEDTLIPEKMKFAPNTESDPHHMWWPAV